VFWRPRRNESMLPHEYHKRWQLNQLGRWKNGKHHDKEQRQEHEMLYLVWQIDRCKLFQLKVWYCLLDCKKLLFLPYLFNLWSLSPNNAFLSVFPFFALSMIYLSNYVRKRRCCHFKFYMLYSSWTLVPQANNTLLCSTIYIVWKSNR